MDHLKLITKLGKLNKNDEKDGKSFIYKKDGTIKKIITYILGEIRYEK